MAGLVHPQTETAVANEALSALHVENIVDLLSDTTIVGKTLRTHFAATRDAMLRQYPWNFATGEKTLNFDPDAPASVRFKYSYALPNDPYCLKARELWREDRHDWKVEGRSILANCGPQVTLIYTKLVTDVAQWDALFRVAFGLGLAVKCKKLCRDAKIIAEVEDKATDALATAWPADVSEGLPDEMPCPDVIAARDW